MTTVYRIYKHRDRKIVKRIKNADILLLNPVATLFQRVATHSFIDTLGRALYNRLNKNVDDGNEKRLLFKRGGIWCKAPEGKALSHPRDIRRLNLTLKSR